MTRINSVYKLPLTYVLCRLYFSLQATTDHYGISMHCGHQNASVNSCGETFHCSEEKITVGDINKSYPKLLDHIYHTLWIACAASLWPEHWGWEIYFLPWYRHISSILLDTCRVICTMVGHFFPPDDRWFGLDTPIPLGGDLRRSHRAPWSSM